MERVRGDVVADFSAVLWYVLKKPIPSVSWYFFIIIIIIRGEFNNLST